MQLPVHKYTASDLNQSLSQSEMGQKKTGCGEIKTQIMTENLMAFKGELFDRTTDIYSPYFFF